MNENLVLCVDDDQLFLRMVTCYLEASGYTVIAETSGREALRKVAGGCRLYAAVLDCLLPGAFAGEFALELNRLHPETPVIILTGSRTAVPARVSAVADVVLSKESSLDDLISALDRAVKLPHPKAVRRFPRYPLQMSFLLKLVRSDMALNLHGTTTSLAEGGLGAVLDGELFPGEDVKIEFLSPPLQSVRPQAQVRYREGNRYGFEFLGLDSSEKSVLRDVLSVN